VTDDATLQRLIDEIVADVAAANNPYFRALQSGDLTKDDFVETQVQFYSAVVFFSRPMAALAAKIPTPDLRVEVVRNVWEEHGEGNPGRMHARTFATFLERLAGIGLADIEARTVWPEVRLFNTALAGACVLEDYRVGAAMLGMIERTFCEQSAWIGRAVVARGWLRPEELVHYTVHEVLDVRHAQDFFDVVRPSWNAGAEHRDTIEQGLRLGAVTFDRLWEDLYRHRARRLFAGKRA